MPGLSHVDYEELGARPASTNMASAMTIADVSPRLALQRLLMLYENADHREAAAFLRRLSPSTFKTLLPMIPADLFIESMPHSLPILEALYSKLFLAGDKIWQETRTASNLRPEAVVWQMVRFFASQEDGLVGQMRWDFCGPFISSCKRLLSVLLTAEPRVRRLVAVCLCVSKIYISQEQLLQAIGREEESAPASHRGPWTAWDGRHH